MRNRFWFVLPHCLLCLVLLSSNQLNAQLLIIDKDTKLPISNVRVSSTKASLGKSSEHGRCDFYLPQEDTLIFTKEAYHPFLLLRKNASATSIIEMSPNLQSLSELVIKAGRFDERKMDAARSISILRVNTSEQVLALSVSETLKESAGVMVQEGTQTTRRITIRGIGSRTPYGTNRIKTYFGEIPLSGGDGLSSIEDISSSALGRIEVIKGTSPLYGASLGGVILLQPSYPLTHGLSASVSQSLASFGTYQTAGDFSLKQGQFVLNAGIASVQTDGFRQNNQFSRHSGFASAQWFGKKHHLHMLANYSAIFGQIPSSLNYTDFTTSPSKAAFTWLNIRGHEDYDRFLLGLSLTSDLNNHLHNTLTLFSTSSKHYESRPFNILNDASQVYGYREQIRYTGKGFSFALASDAMRENYDWTIHETDNGTQGALLNIFNEERFLMDNSFALHANISSKIKLESSITWSLIAFNLHDEFNKGLANMSGEYKFSDIWSPRLALNYLPQTNMHLFVSFSKGYAAPSVEESLLPDGNLNPHLLPETGFNYELGITGTFKEHIQYELSFYHIRLNNMLVTKRLSEDTFMGINAGVTDLNGVELGSRINLLKKADHQLLGELHFSSSHNRFKHFIDNGLDYSGNALPAIPSFDAGIKINYSLKNRWQLESTINTSGKQWLNDANTLTYNGHTLLKISASYTAPLRRHLQLSLYASGNNLLNQNYASMLLPNAKSFGSSLPRYYYPGLPRNFSLGLKLAWSQN